MPPKGRNMDQNRWSSSHRNDCEVKGETMATMVVGKQGPVEDKNSD